MAPPLPDKVMDALRAAGRPQDIRVGGAAGRARIVLVDTAEAFPSGERLPEWRPSSSVTAGPGGGGTSARSQPQVLDVRRGRASLRMVPFDPAVSLSQLTGTRDASLVLCRDGTEPYHGAGNDGMDGVGDADPVAACKEAVGEPRVGGPRVQVPDVRAGWVTVPGPGRPLGSGLDLHESMGDATVVAMCDALLTAVRKEFAEDRYRTGIVEKLETLQAGTGLSLSAVKNSVWTLERSGIVGLLFRYTAASNHTRDGSHNMVAVEATWSTEVRLLLACSEVEACLDAAGGCCSAPAVLNAFEKVRAAVNLPMQTVLELLVVMGNPFAKVQGRGVLYGQSLCVVRRGLPSWPLVVLHKSRKGLFICLTCPNSHL